MWQIYFQSNLNLFSAGRSVQTLIQGRIIWESRFRLDWKSICHIIALSPDWLFVFLWFSFEYDLKKVWNFFSIGWEGLVKGDSKWVNKKDKVLDFWMASFNRWWIMAFMSTQQRNSICTKLKTEKGHFSSALSFYATPYSCATPYTMS